MGRQAVADLAHLRRNSGRPNQDHRRAEPARSEILTNRDHRPIHTPGPDLQSRNPATSATSQHSQPWCGDCARAVSQCSHRRPERERRGCPIRVHGIRRSNEQPLSRVPQSPGRACLTSQSVPALDSKSITPRENGQSRSDRRHCACLTSFEQIRSNAASSVVPFLKA